MARFHVAQMPRTAAGERVSAHRYDNFHGGVNVVSTTPNYRDDGATLVILDVPAEDAGALEAELDADAAVIDYRVYAA